MFFYIDTIESNQATASAPAATPLTYTSQNTLSFPSTDVDKNSTVFLSVTASGSPLVTETVTFTDNSNQFMPLTASMQFIGGQTSSVAVRFNPTGSAGIKTARLTLSSSNGYTKNIDMTGSGVAVKSIGTLNGIAYSAKTAGAAGNNINITTFAGAAAIPTGTGAVTLASSTGTSYFSIEAKTAGSGGNEYRITAYLNAQSAATYATYDSSTKRIEIYDSTNALFSCTTVRNALLANSTITSLFNIGAITGTAGASIATFNTAGTQISTYDAYFGGGSTIPEETTALTVNTATNQTIRIAASETSRANVVTFINNNSAHITATGTGTITSKTGTIKLSGGAG